MAREITVHELKRMRDAGERHALLDVRERGEIYLQQILGHTPVPRGLLELRVDALLPVKDIPVAVICSDGRRSQLAAATLEEMGYQDVRTVVGGIQAWAEAGYPTVEGIGVPGKEYGEMVAVTRKIPQITAEELVARRDAGEKFLILDSRTVTEYQRAHLPGAYAVPGGELPSAIYELAPEEDTTIVVNCAGRTRSILGTDLVLRMGLPNQLYAFKNGTMAWEMAGLQPERGEGRSKPQTSDKARAEAERFAERVAGEDGLRAMPVEELVQLRESAKLHYLVDVRLPEEYIQGHIPGAVSCSGGQVALNSEVIIAVKDAPVVFVCDHQARATLGASTFTRMGFPTVYLLRGGLEAWRAAGLPLEEGAIQAGVFGLEAARKQVDAIPGLELKARLDRGEASTLLDVRSSAEYALGHIPGSLHIARGNLEEGIPGLLPNREAAVVALCDTGIRSALAAATLERLGFPRIGFLAEGIEGWQQSGLPLEEGLQGSKATLEFAKFDIETVKRTGTLSRSHADMVQYLTWEEKLGEKYAEK